MKERKRIAVTGGYGFIGNELVRQIKDDHDVVILDNGARRAPCSDDISDVASVSVDITDSDAVEMALAQARAEVVIHLAAIHYIPECNAYPEHTLNVNLSGTNALARKSAKSGVRHFIYISSGAIYADSADPLVESSTVGPVDIYGWSKWFGEDLCRWQAREGDMAFTIVRLFNTYGPRETNAHILPEIINQLKSGNVLKLGNIKPRRDYIYVTDTARALRLLAEQEMLPNVRTMNLCSGNHASVEQLIAKISGLLGRDIEVHVDSSRFRASDKAIQVGDNSGLFAEIGWRPEVDLQRGLRQLLEFEGLVAAG